MADMKLAGVDFVIDADGFKQTESALQAMDKFMEKLQLRAERLSRIRITPIVKLSDCLCEPLRKIRTSLESLMSKSWVVSVRAEMSDYSAIVNSGKDAGRAFSGSFTAGFDASGIADKVQEALNGITLNASVAIGSGSEGNKDDKSNGLDWTAIIQDTISGTASDLLASAIKKSLTKGVDVYKSRKGGKSSGASSTSSGILKPDGKEYYPSPQPAKKPSLWNRLFKGNKAAQPSPINALTGNNATAQPSPGGKIQTGSHVAPNAPKVIYGADGKVLSTVSSEPSAKVESKLSRVVGKTKSFGSKVLDSALIAGSTQATKGVLKASKFLGKISKPLGIVSDVAQIATASNGTERAKAVGSVAGGWGGAAAGAAAGAAIGSIFPVVGTAIGGLIGGALGGLGGSKVGDMVGGWTASLFGKKKKKKDPVSLPQPEETSNQLNGGAQGVLMGAAISASLTSSPPAPTPAPAPTINVPAGAVQITVKETELDYDAIALTIGSKLAASMKQTMENRA
ncbi:hypothetical protein [Cohnella sp. REN36]|uniref:hypothetical protein n=1 Tax=Cohnella sp. REN36 TaxID=2887347 RepID=UPI001D138D74|nr:hypothetical protein [Cohnella sp. REN36]MCC3374737.1 hypothetical protein [Cohnella sp. REN36]